MTDMTTTVTTEGITMTRVFDAPPAAVFHAWTDPGLFGAWFGGDQVKCEDVVLDVRPGGAWRATMVLPDGDRINWSGEFREVVPPQRLVLTMVDRVGIEERELITVELSEVDGGTRMVFNQTGGNNSEEDYGRAANGWSGFFDALESLLP